MDPDLLFFLLGYPLSILSNIHTEYFIEKLKNYKSSPLKSLFVEAFLSALQINKQKVDRTGRVAIKAVERKIRQDKDKLFHILHNCLGDNSFKLYDLRSEEMKNQIADAVLEEFQLSNISLARSVICDCLYEYEVAFFSQLTEKDGIQFLINNIKKLNSDVAKKSDINQLKQFLVAALSERKSETPALDELSALLYEELVHSESRYFSDSIVNYMASIKKKVKKLTQDQYQIIHHLRYRKLVAISGCAGSGKTLLAAEKAIRLDQAGLRTLILCHNPILADYIRNLVNGSSVDVYDITNFVNRLARTKPVKPNSWHKYIEPFTEDIENAFDHLDNFPITYEAIIVDEGQDFRGLWWLLVEAILEKSTNKILYIFYDDNQSLLPFRSKYPIEKSPISMSKNCRNGGNIFEIVKRFHPNSPLISQFLRSDGVAKITVFDESELKTKVIEAVQDAARYADYRQISIITNEQSVKESILSDLNFTKHPNLDWRESVLKDLTRARNRMLARIERLRHASSISEIASRFSFPVDADLEEYFKLPSLSHHPKPTSEDIVAVRDLARKLAADNEGKGNPIVTFKVQNAKLRLVEYVPPNYNRCKTARSSSRLLFYSRGSWADTLPTELSSARITQYSNNVNLDDSTVPLYSIDMFKGLESDAVILFVNSINKALEKELYVGSSRAIGYLNIVISRSVLARIRKLDELHDSK